MSKVLVSGGAGFIGSHLVDALVGRGDEVLVVDDLDPTAHQGKPDYLNPKARYLFGDIGDPKVLDEALPGTQVIYHLAALLGLEQSQREPAAFVRQNSLATATLVERVAGRAGGRVERFVVASSNTVYGEGPSRCRSCGHIFAPGMRSVSALERKEWEPTCPKCGGTPEPVPTPEEHPLTPASVYAITKRDQEELALRVLPFRGVPTLALRFFNVYGPRQSPFNPYAGVISLFRGRILRGEPPIVYEDGKQSRDFVSVHDVASALVLAGTREISESTALNVGTGVRTPILEVAAKVLRLSDSSLVPQVANAHRSVDVRHSYASLERTKKVLGYEPKYSLDAGLKELFTPPIPG